MAHKEQKESTCFATVQWPGNLGQAYKLGAMSVYSDILKKRSYELDQHTRALTQQTILDWLEAKRGSVVPEIWGQESLVGLPMWPSRSEVHSALEKWHMHSFTPHPCASMTAFLKQEGKGAGCFPSQPQFSHCHENSPARGGHKSMSRIYIGYLQIPGSKITQG